MLLAEEARGLTAKGARELASKGSAYRQAHGEVSSGNAGSGLNWGGKSSLSQTDDAVCGVCRV